MTRSCAVVVILGASLSPVQAQQPTDQVTYVDAAKVAEAFAGEARWTPGRIMSPRSSGA